MSQEDDDMTTRLAAVHLTLIWAARRRADKRVASFERAYAPILARLSVTELFGLMNAVVADSERRRMAGDDLPTQLFDENASSIVRTIQAAEKQPLTPGGDAG